MRDESILDDAIADILGIVKMVGPGLVPESGTASREYEIALRFQKAKCASVPIRRALVPAKAEMMLSPDMKVLNPEQVRHLEDSTLALDKDVLTRVKLIHESGITFFESKSGIRMGVEDPVGTLGSPFWLCSDMSRWMAAFKKVIEASRSVLAFPASAELVVEWPGMLRLTPQGQVFWEPGTHPEYSSIEELCDATIAVWSIMES